MTIYYALLLILSLCIVCVMVYHDHAIAVRTAYDNFKKPQQQKLSDLQRIYNTILTAVNDNEQPYVDHWD